LGSTLFYFSAIKSSFASQTIEPAVLEFSVKSNIEIIPDGVYMLEGARVPMKVVETVKTKDGVNKRGNGKIQKSILCGSKWSSMVIKLWRPQIFLHSK